MPDTATDTATDTDTAAAPPRIAPFGTWASPLDTARLAAGTRPLSAPRVLADGRVRWLEGLPAEGGRVVVVELDAHGTRRVLTPAGFNVRTRVHEYGGGAWATHDETSWFSNFSDSLVYEQQGEAAPRALTGTPAQRHADLEPDLARRRLIAVREDHGTGAAEPVNTLVALSLDAPGEFVTLDAGADFFAAPRLSPEGRRLAWLRWQHPQMPWEGTELWLAAVADDGTLTHQRRIAGGPGESLVQPQWGPDGRLYVASDRSGFWNLHRVDADGLVPLWTTPEEFARPQWVFGQCTYGFLGAHEILAVGIAEARARLWRIDTHGRAAPQPVEMPFDDIAELRVGFGRIVAQAGSPTMPESIVQLALDGAAPRVLARSVDDVPDARYLSVARAVSYPSAGGRTAHAFHYPPCNADFRAPAGELPPLVVIIHGGPTSMTVSTLRLAVQFWTTRGFAVLDVNYGGSTGFGRAYRERLSGQWGVVDVEDCVAGARHLAAHGGAHPARLAIRGGSAGGYTTLCALAFHDVFRAGASWYGVGDLRALDADTHKFESRYTHDLLGPPAAREALYAERSPLHHADRIACPVIFFQGLDDKVVPPGQSETMVAALTARGVPAAYLAFEGEGHGFRRRETIERAFEAELAFYAQVFGFVPAGGAAPIPWVARA
jgi:dipeptidyl aminopeptidase/acylaminoacyl peptidase